MSDLTPTRPSEDPFDRRQAGNTSVQWVRDAFREQNTKIDQVAADVREISTNLKKSWRDGDPDKHWDDHELFKEREKERQRLEAAQELKKAEQDAFIKNLKKEALSYGVKALAAFVLALLVLGGEVKFKQAVQWAVGADTKQEAPK